MDENQEEKKPLEPVQEPEPEPEVITEEPQVVESESDRLRRKIKKDFIEVVFPLESLLSPELVAYFCGIDTRTAYRWKANPLWLPPLRACKAIENFTNAVRSLRGELDSFIRYWDSPNHTKGELGRLVFRPGALSILNDRHSTTVEKRELLVKKLLLQHVQDVREAEKQRVLKRREREMMKTAEPMTKAEREKMAEVLTKAPDWTGRGQDEEK